MSRKSSDNLNTPSLIRTIPSVPEFHRTPCLGTVKLPSHPRTVTADREFSFPKLVLFGKKSPCPEDITAIQLFRKS